MTLKNRKYLYLAWGALLAFISTVFFAGLIIKLQSNCHHATDFSIYQEAIYKIAAFGDFNPFLTIRNVKIFNDHFDPIILLASLFVKIFGYHAENLILFEYLWFVSIIAFVWLQKDILTKNKLIFSTMILFTKGILSGLNFPIHPTTWSLLPSFLLPFIIRRNKNFEIFLLAALTCIFKESFPFSILMLGVFYSLRKEKIKGIGLLAIALCFLIFNFHFRKVLFGPTLNYGMQLLHPILKNPFTGILNIFVNLGYPAFFKVLYPFFIPLFLIFRKHRNIESLWKDKELVGVIFYFAPIFAIQLIANNIHFQYGAQLTAPLLGLIVINHKVITEKSRLTLIMVLLFIGSGIGSVTKNFRAVFAPKQRFCIISDEKSKLNEELKQTLKNLPNDYDVLATGGVIPMLLTPYRKFYQAGYFSEKRTDHKLLILERNGSGKTFPLTRDFIEQVIPICGNGKSKVIIKNKFFFMAENPNIECLKEIHKKWVN